MRHPKGLAKGKVRLGLVALALCLGLGAGAAARAAPANDNFADALEIPGLPPSSRDFFHDSRDTSLATMEPGEPTPCGLGSASVWYRITPSSTDFGIQVSTFGSDYDTVVAVYLDTGVGTDVPLGFERLSLRACNDDDAGSRGNSVVGFTAVPLATYYFQVGAFGATGGGSLSLQVFRFTVVILVEGKSVI